MYEGNHDFHLDPFFTRTVGATIHRGSSIEVIDGKRVYLCHGDQINQKEFGYRLLRLVLHGPIIRFLTATAPIALTAAIARMMSRQSKKNHHQNRKKWDFAGLARSFAETRFEAGCDAVITGHFHTPLMEQVHGKTLLSLGDWITHYSYGEWKDGRLTLQEYR